VSGSGEAGTGAMLEHRGQNWDKKDTLALPEDSERVTSAP
jgi:hypothetical protein